MKHPMDIARELYASNGAEFVRDLGFCHRHGYVISSPERLIMFYPVRLDRPDNPCKLSEANAWNIHLAVGENCLDWFMRQIPKPLPFFTWVREFKKTGMRHIWPADKLSRKVLA